MARHVDIERQAAGADLGLRDAGYRAPDALRIEAGRRSWGAELGPDETPFETPFEERFEEPFEAGWAGFVRFGKGSDFIGRAALLAAQGQPLQFVLADAADFAWGGEAILLAGQPVGELSAAGWSPKAVGLHGAGRCARPGSATGACRHAGADRLVGPGGGGHGVGPVACGTGLWWS